MGVLNVTPDSFSGDGIYRAPEQVARAAHAMEVGGADLVDIGGESTRPGYTSVAPDEEIERVLPALEAVRSAVRVPISVDTSKAQVARRALAAGARFVNDVSGLRDPEMANAVAEVGAGIVLVHNGSPDDGTDLLAFVAAGLELQAGSAVVAGVPRERIMIDPGLGMGKGWRENFEIIRRLGELRALGFPILIGPSRKGMIGRVLHANVHDRVEGTIALVTLCIAAGADVVRVHDVPAMARAARMTDALVRPQS